jgi:sulfur carrier protein ThiS
MRVLGGRHPLTNEHRQVEVEAGATIAEALDIAIASTGLDWPPERFVASVNDVRVPREYWHRVRPKPGTMVIFRPVASGQESLRTLLFLGIAVAALFIAPFIAGPAILGLTGAALSAGTALIGGAITIGGALLLNALMPLRPPQQDTGQPKTLPMISGASNEARPWGSIPVVLGRHRISPMYAAMPYSFFSGNKQYMNLIFCVGYGPLHIEPASLRIGDTPITQFEEVQKEIDEGRDPLTAVENIITLFPRNVNELPLGQVLKSSFQWVNRVTGDLTRTISIDVIAAQGIWIFDKKTGKYKDRPVTVNVQYRKYVKGQAANAGWIARPNIVFHVNRDTYRKGDQWNVLPAGFWEVRLRKVTADYPVGGKDQVADTIIWQTLRGFQTGVPIYFPQRLALIGLRVRATDQFNGVINSFNCIAQSYVSHWNGSTWVPGTLSSNPGDLFLQVLTGPANARPRTAAQIDYDSIQRWAKDCTDRGFTYNAVISDQRTVREVLSDIAAAGRATVALRNGKWGVSFARNSDDVSWHFTPRNSSGLKSTRTYREMPHALRVRYIDGSVKGDWKQSENIVYNDTPDGSGPNGQYTAATAHLYETVEFPGITDKSLVHKSARFQLAQALLRPETHTLTADIESLRLERGDKVILSTDTLLIGTGYGRVISVDPITQTVVVDSRVIMEPGKTYQVKFTIVVAGLPQFLTRTVLNSSSETDVLHLAPYDVPPTMPAPGNLFSFGTTLLVTNDYRVLDVRPGADLSAQFMLVDDAPNIEYEGDIPDYDPGMDGQPNPYTLTPQSITFNESFSGYGYQAKSTVQLTVQIPRVGTIRAFEFQSLDVDNNGDWTPFAVVNAPLLTATKDNMEPGNYQFRVRALFREDYSSGPNDFSAWVDQITGMDGLLVDIVRVHNFFELPPDVENFHLTILGDIMRFEWDAVSAFNLAYYRIRYNAVTDTSALWGSSVELTTTTATSFTTPTRSGTYLIKAVTFAQAESQNENDIVVVTTAGPHANILDTFYEAPFSPNFPGTHHFTQVQGGLLLTLTVGTSIITAITSLGLNANMRLLLESGTLASWPGSGQKWLDESGNGYDFFLGPDGTVAAAGDPAFVGAPGDATRNAYWNFDGNDYFTYDAVNEAWMDNLHMAGAKWSAVFSVYIPTLGVDYHLAGTAGHDSTKVGFNLFITGNHLELDVSNGGVGSLAASGSLVINTVGWHVVGVSVDEAAGIGTFMIDNVTEDFVGYYDTPSTAASAYKMQIGSAGNAAFKVPNGTRLRAFGIWEGVILTPEQMLALANMAKASQNYTLNQGFYQFAQYVDLGRVYTSRITANVTAHGISAGDTMDHWTTLADVAKLDTSDPSSWSIETVYVTSDGPQPKSILQLITDQGLLTNLKLCLEAGNSPSWPGTGQKWLDESGGGYDFFLGPDATVSATTDPAYVGSFATLQRWSGYWNFNATSYFTYDSVNETWMDAIHKDNAKFSILISLYVATLDSLSHYLTGDTNSVTQVGFQIYIANNKLVFLTTNGTAQSYGITSNLTIAAIGWHTVGITIDEAAGTGTFILDDAKQDFTGVVFASPSAATATFKMQIGAAGNAAGIIQAGWHVHSVAMWQGTALTSSQLAAIGSAIQHNDDLIFGDTWQPFSITDVTARAIVFGIRLNGSVDGSVSPAVVKLSVTVDMPDRHEGYHFDNGAGGGSGTSPGGFTILFDPPFKKLTDITLANYNLNTTNGAERYSILSRDENHVTIIFQNNSTVLDRSFDLHAYGYGEVVP